KRRALDAMRGAAHRGELAARQRRVQLVDVAAHRALQAGEHLGDALGAARQLLDARAVERLGAARALLAAAALRELQRLAKPVAQLLAQGAELAGLAEIVVQAGRRAALERLGERVGGERNDGRLAVRELL